jgi:hypothetical protein
MIVMDIAIGLVPGGGPQGMTSPVAYWHVLDIEAKLAEVTAAVPREGARARRRCKTSAASCSNRRRRCTATARPGRTPSQDEAQPSPEPPGLRPAGAGC